MYTVFKLFEGGVRENQAGEVIVRIKVGKIPVSSVCLLLCLSVCCACLSAVPVCRLCLCVNVQMLNACTTSSSSPMLHQLLSSYIFDV